MKSRTVPRRGEAARRRASTSLGETAPGTPFLYVGGLLFLGAVLTYLDHFTVGRAGYPFWVLLSVLGTVSSATGTLSLYASDDPIARPGGWGTDMVVIPRAEWIELQQQVQRSSDRTPRAYGPQMEQEPVDFPRIRSSGSSSSPPHRTGIRRPSPLTEALDVGRRDPLRPSPLEEAPPPPVEETRPDRHLPVDDVVAEIERLVRTVGTSRESLPGMGLPKRRIRTAPAPVPDVRGEGPAAGARLMPTRGGSARGELPLRPPSSPGAGGVTGAKCTSCGAGLGPRQPTYPCESCGEPRCLDCKERGVAQGHSLLCPRCAYVIEEAERELQETVASKRSGPPD